MHRRAKLFFGLLFGILAVSSSAPSSADVVHEMPLDCPRGTEKGVSHDGSYCSPPQRADCPPGYVPRVSKSTSYCEPPPPEVCPKGMHWWSSEPTNGACTLNDRCENKDDCSEGGGTCESLKFCLHSQRFGRAIGQAASGTCRTQADCKDPADKCEARLTCTDPANRKNQAQRIEAAKKVDPSKVPEPYVASAFGGKPPRYPILKDGQKLPPLPDVPEPPDNTPPDNTPPEVAPTSTPSSAPSAGPTPTPTVTPEPPAKAPSGQGGCAGCKVGSSDRDMVGWAALTSAIGIGIALRGRAARRKSK